MRGHADDRELAMHSVVGLIPLTEDRLFRPPREVKAAAPGAYGGAP